MITLNLPERLETEAQSNEEVFISIAHFFNAKPSYKNYMKKIRLLCISVKIILSNIFLES